MNNIFRYLVWINIISFFLCYYDKGRSIKKRKRIPESLLLQISFLGGSLGFFIAMYIFHHKTRKIKFLFLEPFFILMWTFLFLILSKKILFK